MPPSAIPSSTPPRPPARPAPDARWELSWGELAFLLLLVAGGFLFLRDAPHWGRNAYVGSAQFGDAEFWWNGALHFAQGIVADNPNLTFRMGYATFGGIVTAVLGPDYRVFHLVLVAVFLASAGAMYLSLRGGIGPVAAALAVVFLVFNPFTAEWLAISTSDALGLVLNLVAVMALAAGVRDGLHLRWIAVFGIFLACASLTRPLMTPFIAPAALALVVAGWPDVRRVVMALAAMLAAFVLPTLAWMGFMGATTGNFALTGASQDSSAFYAASDPQIQVWRPDMYAAVRDSAVKHFGVERPSPRQLNAEFWSLTRENYVKHWRFHVARLWRNLAELARFTPAQATMHSPESATWRLRFQLILVVGLVVAALRLNRQWPAALVLALGLLWLYHRPSGPWLVLAGAIAGLVSLSFRRPALFLWAAYWWVGVAALYLTGGTWGPPLGAEQGLNALGYRLGFQFLFGNDLLVLGLLGCISMGFLPKQVPARPLHPLLLPAPIAGRALRTGAVGFLVLLALLLGCGTSLVAYRIAARSRATPVPYPALASVRSLAVARDATEFTTITPLRSALSAATGMRALTPAMSSGFVWNMPGQERSMLLIYQQDNVSPIALSPRQLYVEVSRHLVDRKWTNRQGAWLLRSFPDTAQTSNLPYYFEMPAVQAFVPLGSDGRSYDLARATLFPIAKTATQLVASGELIVTGSPPEWSTNSGPLQFPRRFAMRAAPEGPAPAWTLDLSRARGSRFVRFAVQFDAKSASGAPHLRLATNDGTPLWEADLESGADPVPVQPILPVEATGLHLTVQNLPAGEAVWFYELVLTADDFTQ